MRVTGLSETDAIRVVKLVGMNWYNDNLSVARSNPTSVRSCTISVRTKDSRAYGSRYAASGRHVPAASWEAMRDVIRAMFEAGATRIVTRYANYTKDNFEDTYDNIDCPAGSMMYPVDLRQLTI